MLNQNRKRVFFFLTGILVLMTWIANAEPPKQKPLILKPNILKAPQPALVRFPDVTVTSMKVTLVSTDAGKPGVEFPMDKVKIEATLKNSGEGAVPPGSSIYVSLKRNHHMVSNSSSTDVLSSRGSFWEYSYTDTFAHEEAPVYDYRISVSGNFNESSTSNNERSYVVKESALHPGGSADLVIDNFYCEKKVISGSNVNFDCQVFVKNQGTGTIQGGGTLLRILKSDDQKILGTETLDSLQLPGPGFEKSFTVTLTGQDIPKGSYNVVARVEPMDGESNKANNTSQSACQINNTLVFLTAIPDQVPTGGNVTLEWDVQSLYPNETLTGVEIRYDGFVSGKIPGLAGAGQVVVCPYGTTTYTLKHPTKPNIQAQVTVQSECPSFTINDDLLLALQDTLKQDVEEAFDKVSIDSLTVKIRETGIVIDLKGAYHKEHLPAIDLKVHSLAFPSTPTGPITVEIKEFDIHIGSTATRVAWDIVTLGLYEEIKKELEDHFEHKYRVKMQDELIKKLNSLITWKHNQLCFLKLRNSEMDVYKCTQCLR